MVEFSWKEIAARKQAFVLSQIPEAWKLDHIPSADEESNVSEYLDRILPDNEVHITSEIGKRAGQANIVWLVIGDGCNDGILSSSSLDTSTGE